MKKDNLHEKNISKNCDLCGNPIMVDQYGFGSCKHCGWVNVEASVERSNEVCLPNFVTFNRAKRLYIEGKPLNPNFDEFMEFVRVYGEVEFTYKNKVYGVIRGDQITIFCDGIENSSKHYKSYVDFRERADIDGRLLKDIWDEVEKVDYLQ